MKNYSGSVIHPKSDRKPAAKSAGAPTSRNIFRRISKKSLESVERLSAVLSSALLKGEPSWMMYK